MKGSEIERIKKKYSKKEKDGFVHYQNVTKVTQNKKIKEFVIGSMDMLNDETKIQGKGESAKYKEKTGNFTKTNKMKIVNDETELPKMKRKIEKESSIDFKSPNAKVEIYSRQSEAEMAQVNNPKESYSAVEEKSKKSELALLKQEILKVERVSSKRVESVKQMSKKRQKKSEIKELKKDILRGYLEDNELIISDREMVRIDTEPKEVLERRSQMSKKTSFISNIVENKKFSERKSRVENILENIGKIFGCGCFCYLECDV